MNNKRIIKATLIAALSVSFLFNEPSFASSEEENSVEANSQSLVEDNEGNKEKAEEEKQENSPAKENEQKQEESSERENEEKKEEEKVTNLETSLKEDKMVEADKKSTDDTHKADLSEDSSKEEKKDDKAVEKKDEGRVIYIAEFKDKGAGERAMKEISKLSSTKALYTYNTIFNGCAIETKKENLDLIKHIEGISSVERSQKVEPMMNHAREEIGVNEAIDYLKAINKDMVMKFDGRGMVIANIDTGTDYRHKAMRIDDDAKADMRYKKEDLKGTDKNFWLSDKIPHAFNYYNGGKITVEKYDDGSDYHDPHGMHIAGILAGNDTDEDIAKYKGIDGIAPNAQIFSYKMYSDSGDGFAGDETMFHAIEDAIKHKVDVVSVSSGFTGTGLMQSNIKLM